MGQTQIVSSIGGDITDEHGTSNNIVQMIKEMDSYFSDIVQERTQKPRDDLITNLIKAQVEGRHLSNDEILTFCRLLLLAGHVTTVNLLGNTILSLLQNQAEFRLLQDDQNLIPSWPLSYHILQNLYLLFVRIETRLVALKNGRSCYR